jgi:hypothetical protein
MQYNDYGLLPTRHWTEGNRWVECLWITSQRVGLTWKAPRRTTLPTRMVDYQ